MTVTIDSAEDEPYGRLHPASHGRLFYEGKHAWSSVAQCLLADRVADDEARDRVRYAPGVAAAEALMPGLALREGWRADLPDLLRRVLRARFEVDLVARARLLATGDAPLEVRAHGLLDTEGVYARVLEETRALVRLRASDARAIQCAHQEPETTAQVCEHLISEPKPEPSRWFQGEDARYHMLCAACASALPAAPELRTVCGECFSGFHGGKRGPDVNEPPYRTRASSLRFESERVPLPELDAREVLAVAPVAQHTDTFLVLDRAGRVHRADLGASRSAVVASLAATDFDPSVPVLLIASDDGSFAAVAERYARRAWVLPLGTPRPPLCLLRDDYHPDVCQHPIAFSRVDGRLLLVHATLWNRLDLLEPSTGVVISEREQPRYRTGEPPPAHYLDYFHCGLLVSPDGDRLLDNGWVWHPWGIVTTLSLRAWLTQNVWESEDGPSRKRLASASYFWDRAACWLDARTVALWGLGDDDLEMVAGVRIFDADEGEELRAFAGPRGELACFAGHLVAYGGHGASVWDAETGERLLHAPELAPVAAHPQSQALLSFEASDFVISRLAATSPSTDAVP